jgi:hypothetical protein
LARITDDGRPFVNAEDVVRRVRTTAVGVHDGTMHELAGRDFVVERGGGTAPVGSTVSRWTWSAFGWSRMTSTIAFF